MQIFIHRDGRQFGPYSADQVRQMLAEGELKPDDLAWHEGLTDWQPLGSLPSVAPTPSGRPATGRVRRVMVAAAGLALGVVGAVLATVAVDAKKEGETAPASASATVEVLDQVSNQAGAPGANAAPNAAFEFRKIEAFLDQHCLDCHDADAKKGGLDLMAENRDLNDPAALARWVRLYDRVEKGEMPPKKKRQPAEADRTRFLSELKSGLTVAHARHKGTVLRRLNRVEYANTMNDLFGTRLDLASMLPEDGRSHEFDNVGRALSVSPVQLQALLEAADRVMEAAIENRLERPEPKVVKASYLGSREGKQFVGKAWGRTLDDAVVFFKRSAYPTGMLRDARAAEPGYYRVRVTAYAYQSSEPITFSIGATTFQRGADKPTFGYFSAPAGKPATIEIEAFIDRNYMIQIEPFGLSVNNNEFKKIGPLKFKGPGLAIKQVELVGPLVKEYPSRGHRLLFDGVNRHEVMPRNPNDRKKKYYRPKFTVETTDPVGDATRVLLRVASRAFRRPVTEAQLDPYVKLFKAEMAQEASFEEALRTAVAAVFCSPNFLYLREKPGRLDDYALASRLSYFLIRTLPDEALLAAAEAGKLSGDPKALAREVDRLLGDPRSERFVRDFTDAWLDLRNIDFTNPDRKLFPEFDDFLKYSMLAETRAFFRQLIEENLSVANFIDSDFAMLNWRLAEHYGVPGVRGPEIRKVRLPEDSPRGGILAHASILKVSANGTTTSPVVRGVWTLERLMGITPPPPPPAVPGVEPDIRGASTLRELLDKHRSLISCQGCHQLIDPPGFALEVFNPIGGYRERFRSIGAGERVNLEINGRRVSYKLGPPVDASGQLLDGRRFKDFREFKRLLLDSRQQVAECVTRKLLTFATGREMGFSDRPEIKRIVNELDRSGGGLRSLIHLIVQSEIFRTK